MRSVAINSSENDRSETQTKIYNVQRAYKKQNEQPCWPSTAAKCGRLRPAQCNENNINQLENMYIQSSQCNENNINQLEYMSGL